MVSKIVDILVEVLENGEELTAKELTTLSNVVDTLYAKESYETSTERVMNFIDKVGIGDRIAEKCVENDWVDIENSYKGATLISDGNLLNDWKIEILTRFYNDLTLDDLQKIEKKLNNRLK